MNVMLNFSRFCNMTLGTMEYTGSFVAQIVDAGEVLTAESKDIVSRFFNSSEWLKRSAEIFLEKYEIPTEMLYGVALSVLILVMFIWFVMKGREEIVYDLGSLQQREVISIFDLAKTAYLPGHTEQVISLVTELHFDVNFPIPTNGMTLFLCACISGSTNLVIFLLDQGGDVTITNKDGDTPLYLATFTCAGGSSCSDFSLIQTLISAGCDVNAQNHKGNTPLHWAASKGDVELIKFLLDYGADRYIKNNIGMYPIGMATNNGHLRAGKHLKISIPNDPSPWDMFEPNTPVKVRHGLLHPHRNRLAMSPRPRMKLNFY